MKSRVCTLPPSPRPSDGGGSEKKALLSLEENEKEMGALRFSEPPCEEASVAGKEQPADAEIIYNAAREACLRPTETGGNAGGKRAEKVGGKARRAGAGTGVDRWNDQRTGTGAVAKRRRTANPGPREGEGKSRTDAGTKLKDQSSSAAEPVRHRGDARQRRAAPGEEGSARVASRGEPLTLARDDMEVNNIIYNANDSAPFELLRRFPWMALPLHGVLNQYPNLTMVINAKTIQRDTIMGSLRQREVDVPSIGGTTSRSRSHLEELLEAAFDSREWRCVARGMSRPLLHGDSAQRLS